MDDDNSSGSFGGQANGVHITNLDYGNSKDGHSTDFVIGAFNSYQSGKNFHSSGIVGSFSKGVHFLSIEDTDDDNTNKILFALDKEGNVIGQTQPFARTFGVLSSETLDDELIYGFEFDTLSGSDGGSNDDTFTIDNLRVVYADNYQPKDLNSTAALTIAENQPPGTTVVSLTPPILIQMLLTYHLVSGVGDGNNSLFTLDLNSTLKTATVFDFESNASTYSIRVQARDEYNASVEENFTVTLLDIFESADIQIFSNSSTGVNLNLGPGDYKLKYLSGGYLYATGRYRTHTSFAKNRSLGADYVFFQVELLFSQFYREWIRSKGVRF